MVRLATIAVGAVAVFLLASLPALARDDMSGVWVEDYDESIISVEQWGPHCGEAPRSAGRRSRNLSYVVEDRGVDLYFKAIKKGRSFSTAACQSTNKRMKPKERKLKDDLFLINCATSESEQSYESGLYSFRIKSIAKIEYRETSRFSRNIKGALCVHTRRVRRIYTHQIGKKPPEIVGKKVGSDRDDPCRKPGKPVRLELSPAQAEALPGGKVCPSVKAFDKNDCETAATLSWGKGTPPKGIGLDIRGCLKVTAAARPGKTTVSLAAGKAQAQMTLLVKPKLAKKPGLVKPPEPEKPEEPKVDAGTADAGVQEPADQAAQPEPAADAGAPEPAAAAAPVEPEPEGMPGWVLPVAIGGGVLVLAVVLLLVLRKRKPKAEAPPPTKAAEPTVPEPIRPATVPDPAPTTSTDQLAKAFCTTCGKSIPAEAKFCPYDRTPIYRPGSPTLASAPVCPTCKRLLPVGAKFCPYDRTKLS